MSDEKRFLSAEKFSENSGYSSFLWKVFFSFSQDKNAINAVVTSAMPYDSSKCLLNSINYFRFVSKLFNSEISFWFDLHGGRRISRIRPIQIKSEAENLLCWLLPIYPRREIGRSRKNGGRIRWKQTIWFRGLFEVIRLINQGLIEINKSESFPYNQGIYRCHASQERNKWAKFIGRLRDALRQQTVRDRYLLASKVFGQFILRARHSRCLFSLVIITS